MQWLKKYLPIWELGFVLIAIGAIDSLSMIPEILGSPDHSKYVLAVAVIFGTTFVCAYWVRKWYNLREYLAARDSKTLIPRKYVIGLAGFVLLIWAVSHFSYQYVTARPEFLESQNAVKANPAVISEFGDIKDLQMDATGYEYGFEGADMTGAYQFKLKGTTKDGVVRLSWRDHGGAFVVYKIEEITWENPETLNTIWTKPNE